MKKLSLLAICTFLLVSCNNKVEYPTDFETIPINHFYASFQETVHNERPDSLRRDTIFAVNTIGEMQNNEIVESLSEQQKSEMATCDFGKNTMIISCVYLDYKPTKMEAKFIYSHSFTEYFLQQTITCASTSQYLIKGYRVVYVFSINKINNLRRLTNGLITGLE